ncbi:hypothetical protein A167_00042 [Alcanivorax sp. S71-1-4]|uniref:YqaJ viral recombinase family nuclease n=1 Tax=Alcanivorax sp. S71-1-4 TaxID=1177159 RepID=UPI0013589CF9|nr:YqaJ viral recombinase family protein [Alcanivorax sp. S71-1-4]KAF0811010.1 hypothetical protein A167_00042 [Alcanivorax sp. S71-1-4]
MPTPSITPNRPRPALRLVSTKGMSREQWLQVRKRGIGASEAAAAASISPYQSRLALWMDKTGRARPQVDADDMSSPLYWGNVLEPVVAEQYSRKTGNKVRRINAVLQHPDPDKAWMLANLDYTVVGHDAVQILECKTAGEFGARLWRDGVPDYVQCQVQHQLAVTGKQAADVCVLLCGQDLQVFRVERDEAVINRLIELEREFWRFVETDTPPLADGSDSAGKALQNLYPRDAGNTLDLTSDPSLCGDFDELLDIRERVSRLSTREATLKQRIQQAMGEASKAVFPNGDVSWKRSQDSTVLDYKRLLKNRPGLLHQYPLRKAGSRRFLVRT